MVKSKLRTHEVGGGQEDGEYEAEEEESQPQVGREWLEECQPIDFFARELDEKPDNEKTVTEGDTTNNLVIPSMIPGEKLTTLFLSEMT